MSEAVGSPAAPESKYRILAELGQGGTAVVSLAVARGPNGFSKLVVLKKVKKSLADDADLIKMFRREARLSARLNHPHIVQTYEVIEEQGLPAIVMEYLEGQPLSRVLMRAQGKLSLQAHLRIIADALNGLQHAHELADFDGKPLGLVHRDITPHNVFVTYDGQTKLLDFGIAKLTTGVPETQTGVIKGKLRYMPPEQISGEAADRRIDIFAIGVMLWEAAAGEQLWKGCSEAQVMHRVINGEIPSPRTVRPDVPEQLERICMKALSPDREGRHSTAADLESELEDLLGELGSRVSNRAIGKIMSDLFVDARSSMKALIEDQLAKVASLSSEDHESAEALASVSRTQVRPFAADERVMERPPARMRQWIVMVGLAALALGGVAFGFLKPGAAGDEGQKAQQPAAIPTSVASAPTAPPLGAEIGVAPGPEGSASPDRASTSPTRDAQVEVDPKHGKERLKGHAGGPSTAKPRAAAGDCDPPYTITHDGTKKFKVECL